MLSQKVGMAGNVLSILLDIVFSFPKLLTGWLIVSLELVVNLKNQVLDGFWTSLFKWLNPALVTSGCILNNCQSVNKGWIIFGLLFFQSDLNLCDGIPKLCFEVSDGFGIGWHGIFHIFLVFSFSLLSFSINFLHLLCLDVNRLLEVDNCLRVVLGVLVQIVEPCDQRVGILIDTLQFSIQILLHSKKFLKKLLISCIHLNNSLFSGDMQRFHLFQTLIQNVSLTSDRVMLNLIVLVMLS